MLIVVPFCKKDEGLAIKNLEIANMLDGKSSYPVLLTYDSETDAKEVEDFAKKSFETIYRYQYPAWHGDSKWPAIQNWAWQSTAKHIYQKYRDKAWFWWEADAVPLKKGWIKDIEEEYKKGQAPFMGHIVEKMGHMNGVAVYPGNILEYSTNVMLTRTLPWDVMLKDETIGITHKANHLIAHYPRYNGIRFSVVDKKPLKEMQKRGIAIFHGCNDGTLQDLMLGNPIKPPEEGRKFRLEDIDGGFDESEPIWQQETARLKELGYGCLEYHKCRVPMVPIKSQSQWQTGLLNLELNPRTVHFNNGLTRDDKGVLWTVVRRWDRRGERLWHSTLMACQLDEQMNIVHQQPIRLPGSDHTEHEDPRVTFHNGKFWIGHCVWRVGEPYQARQWFSSFDRKWNYENTVRLQYGNNAHGAIGGAEKNWLWFNHDGVWHVVYKFSPHIVIRNDSEHQITEFKTPTNVSKWIYGEIRGGTPPVLAGNEYVSFFHSSLAWKGRQKRYYMGAYTFSSKPPFNVLRMTLEPLLSGSEQDSRTHGGPCVVFPCGALFENNQWLVTGGLNDEQCFWIKIPHAELMQRMAEV